MKAGGAQIWDSKGWRKAVAVLGAAYCLVAWVLPVVVMLVFRELAYLQERGFLDRSGSRLRSGSLSLNRKEGNGEVHLTLSKRLFDLPEIREGDELRVSGKQTVAGVYVDGFRVLSPVNR